MSLVWLPGARREPAKDAGPFVEGYPFRLVLHTTEGNRLVFPRPYNPHLWLDPQTREVVQSIPFDRAATTAENDPGGVETNRACAIQVEIVGRADGVHVWPADWWAWIGETLRPVVEAFGITDEQPPIVVSPAGRADRWFDARDGTIAVEDAPQRMSHDLWRKFTGVCGHQHVPENNHYDPGRPNIEALFGALFPTGEDDLPFTEEQLRQIIREECDKVVRSRIGKVGKKPDGTESSKTVYEASRQAIRDTTPKTA